ncbi:SIS domain-containing protein [Mycobacterium interjectum]|uniref:SIS domain-containing protein n=1 Tax=Mycobacterium interjectum TaxID=33895 RepID=UPI0008344222|nr:SIS domain-containing protein [Mycobacterium interjectum]MCV7089475.1 SIS domain-containing protein [Mycobacterium interjectum]
MLEFDQAPISLGFYPLVRDHQRHVILTGTGASHFAALPSWRRLVAAGKAASWVDTENLLENPQLVTSDSLLVVTSRSGSGGQVRALADGLRTMRPAAVLAITDDPASPLAAVADCEVLLRSRTSGSPKGFLNALIVHDYVASMILNEDNDDVSSTAPIVATTTLPEKLREVATRVVAQEDSRLAYVGHGEHAAVALYAALLTNEATEIAAEGLVVGERRSDLVRRANAKLTAVFFGSHRGPHAAVGSLAGDLLAAGSNVVVGGGADVPGSTYIRCHTGRVGAEVARNVVVVEHFVSGLAKTNEEAPSDEHTSPPPL